MNYPNLRKIEVVEIFCRAGKLSELKTNVENYSEISLSFTSGIMVQIHLNYPQRYPTRICEISGENGVSIGTSINFSCSGHMSNLYAGGVQR